MEQRHTLVLPCGVSTEKTVCNHVLCGGHAEDLSPGDRLSGSSERLLQRGRGGARIYGSFLQPKQAVGTSKDYYSLKKNQTSQFNEFSHFLFHTFEDMEILDDYKKLVNKNFDKEKIRNYLILFHSEYSDYLEFYERKYYQLVEKKYGSIDNYVKIV